MHAKLVLEPAEEVPGYRRLAARLIEPDGSQQRLWWQIPHEWIPAVTPWGDPWVVGLLFAIMGRARPVHVEGRVSGSLLANLELFMRIWAIWRPGQYHAVSITAEEEAELPPVADRGLAAGAFSCGVDSCFTIFRHARGFVGRRRRRIDAGVVMHGFDVLLDQENADGMRRNILAGATSMLGSVGLKCIPMASNFHELQVDWSHAWGTQLIGGLSLLAGRYDTALVANDLPYAWLGAHWPSHPVTDVLLGSKGLAVVNDGGECMRSEKAKLISQWPEAMQHLRVCFGLDIPGRHDNCCHCEKCTRTILAFRVAGCRRPDAFKDDASDEQIRRMKWNLPTRTLRWQELARSAQAAGMGGTSWAKAIRAAVRRNRWRKVRSRWQAPFIPVRNVIRKWARGTTLSRHQLARLQPPSHSASKDS
jgi:hypothetical protein